MTPFLDVAPAVATARDGTRLSYRLLPGAGGKRIVLTHALGMTGEFWLRVAEPLRQIADVLVWDCRGHGASDTPSGPYRVDQFADDLADLLDTVGWFSAVAVGCSMGGVVCMAFAALYPERPEALGLIDTSAWYGPDARAMWEARARSALDEGMQALAKSQPPRWFAERFYAEHPDRVEAATAMLCASNPNGYAESCRLLGAADLRHVLPGIAVPTAIIVGAGDIATPVAMAEEIQRGIPGATLQVVEGAGHFIPLECPETVAEALAGLSLRA